MKNKMGKREAKPTPHNLWDKGSMQKGKGKKASSNLSPGESHYFANHNVNATTPPTHKKEVEIEETKKSRKRGLLH